LQPPSIFKSQSTIFGRERLTSIGAAGHVTNTVHPTTWIKCMSDLPHLMTDGIVCNSLANGMLEVVLVKNGTHYNSNPLDPKNASRIAATVLNGAKLVDQIHGNKTPASA